MSLLVLKLCGKSFFMCSLEKKNIKWDEGLADSLQKLVFTADEITAPLFWQKKKKSNGNSKIL